MEIVAVAGGDGELERLGKNLNYGEVLYMDCDDVDVDDDDGDDHL